MQRSTISTNAPVVLARLINIEAPGSDNQKLPSMSLSNGHVFLGANNVTGIDDKRVSFRIAKVFVKRKTTRLYVFCEEGDRVVLHQLGGRQPWGHKLFLKKTQLYELSHGDIIGLSYGFVSRYQYRVELYIGRVAVATAPYVGNLNTAATNIITISDTDDDDHNTNTTAPSSSMTAITKGVAALAVVASPPTAPPPRLSFPQLAQEIECSLCCQMMVKPVTLIACGHSFCAGCLDEQLRNRHARCSICRAPMTGRVKAIVLENLIEHMVHAAARLPSHIDLLDNEECEMYAKRKEHANADNTTTTVTSK